MLAVSNQRAFWKSPVVKIADKQNAAIVAMRTAYSTDVGPSSERINFVSLEYALYMDLWWLRLAEAVAFP